MKNLLASLLLFSVAQTAVASSVTGAKSYGKPFAVKSPISLIDLNKNLESYLGQTVQLQAKIARVCTKKGCWIGLTADGEKLRNLRITFADYGFFVPVSSKVGATAIVVGRVMKKELSEAEQAHLEKDGAKLGADGHPANEELRMVADGIIIGG